MKGYCVSHRKDVDGLGSGAMAVAATGGEIILTDYEDMVANLRSIPDGAERVVITDLGTDTADFNDFLKEVERLGRSAEVTYIDHHYLSEKAKRQIRRAGVKVIHDTGECASILTFRAFRRDLPEEARLVALCGAVTDYMDDSPFAKKLMEQGDRQFVLLEASMLAYALGTRGGEAGFPETVVKELSRMKKPHEIAGVPEAAVEELKRVAALGELVKAQGHRRGKIAYMVTTQFSTGNIAKLLIGAFEVPVGVAMKQKQEGWYEVSLRSTSESRVHLGRAIAAISKRLGGSGGGHRKAAGCRIPVSKAEEMLSAVAKRV